MPQQVTISEALGLKKILAARYHELVSLRNENSHKETRYIGQNADKEIITEPKYDVKKLDALITKVAREQRLLDSALKNTNATQGVKGYEWDDAVLGEVE